MKLKRREMCAMLPALALPAMMASAEEAKVLASEMFPFEKMTARKESTTEIREILKGKMATGESIEVHQTTLVPGGMPHPPHRHVHSEMWLIREGTVELMVEGKSMRMGPGSLGFVRSNDEHGIKNVGSEPATYFVVEIGPGTAG
jgi:mannose-6-phosphate isomerase-like protein (cupin superfamily)